MKSTDSTQNHEVPEKLSYRHVAMRNVELVEADIEAIPHDLRAAILGFVREEDFQDWLRTPNAMMSEQIPLELLKHGHERVIWKAIRIARGSLDPREYPV